MRLWLRGKLLFYYSYALKIISANDNNVKNNTINDKKIYYLYGESDRIIDSDAGQIIIIKCNNITVQNQEISDINVGIYFIESNNCLISNNIILNNVIGIDGIFSGENNIITKNTVSNNDYGMRFSLDSNNNKIISNTILNNNNGIELEGYKNIISGNIISNNKNGINLHGSENNISDNNISNNDYGIYFYGSQAIILSDILPDDTSVIISSIISQKVMKTNREFNSPVFSDRRKSIRLLIKLTYVIDNLISEKKIDF